MDETATPIPLSRKNAARLPVFTGFPSDRQKLRAADTALMQDILRLTGYIANDKFWSAQIAQVDITPSRSFEIIPSVGNHIIEFGDMKNYEQKFRSLMLFYRGVLSKVGFNKYERIKVQYNNQVVGVKKAIAVSKRDSLQAVKNVQHLIMEMQRQQQELLKADSVLTGDANPNVVADTVATDTAAKKLKIRSTFASNQNPTLKSHPYEAKARKKPVAMMPEQ